MIIKTIAFPRAALIGNPSDGYHGKTIAFVFRNYQAEAELYETPELELWPSKRDHNIFSCMDALSADVQQLRFRAAVGQSVSDLAQRLRRAAVFVGTAVDRHDLHEKTTSLK